MISINAVIGIISVLGLGGAFAMLWRGVSVWYENKVKEKAANDILQSVVKKGSNYANRPRTHDDIIDRLQRAADKAD